jgi:hypothetical protein
MLTKPTNIKVNKDIEDLKSNDLLLASNINKNSYLNRIIVNQENFTATLGGVIDSTKEYFLDGVINLGSTQITVPSGGINIKGYNFDNSGLSSTSNNYTMFISPSGGSGDVLLSGLRFEILGNSSKLFNLFDSNGTHSFSVSSAKFVNCTSLGEISAYSVGLEIDTRRLGGSPSLTLSGNWSSGYLVSTSLVRGMSNTTTEPLYKAGLNFVMNSRFKTNVNVDLGTLQPFFNFSNINFPNPSTLQLKGVELTRNLIYNSIDTNITPNITESNLSCEWIGNNGIQNTYVGGGLGLTTEADTVIVGVDTFTALAGTFTAADLQHFSSPANGRLTNLGNSPREFKLVSYIIVTGVAGNNITIRIRKFKFSDGTTTTVTSQQSTINNISGGTNRTTFSLFGKFQLDINDYIFIEIANNSAIGVVRGKLGSFITLEER